MSKCPTCGAAIVLEGLATRPFCSERCRMADLGRWLQGSYRIGSPIAEEDLDEGLPQGTPDELEPPQ